jgi:hypothetical protein
VRRVDKYVDLFDDDDRRDRHSATARSGQRSNQFAPAAPDTSPSGVASHPMAGDESQRFAGARCPGRPGLRIGHS